MTWPPPPPPLTGPAARSTRRPAGLPFLAAAAKRALRSRVARRLRWVVPVALLLVAPARAWQTTAPEPAGGGAVEVQVSFYVVDVLRILDAEQAIEADLFYRVEWLDPRLAEAGARQRSMSLDSLWCPLPQPVAPRGLSELMPKRVLVDERGRVSYTQRLIGKFGAATNLQDFPFDQHELRFDFVFPDMQQVQLKVTAGPIFGISKQLTIPDWTVADEKLDLSPYTKIEVVPPLPAASVVVRASRNTLHYLTKVIFPLFVIVMLSWTVFWIPPAQIGVQFGFGSSSVLTVIAYRFAMATQLPRVPYTTRLDAFLNGAFLMAALALVEVVVTAHLLSSDRGPAARRLDVACRWTFPALLAALTWYSFIL